MAFDIKPRHYECLSHIHYEYTHIWESRHYINGNLRKDAVFSDKHLEISEKQDDFFTREGDDLHCEVKVPIHKLVLGGTQRIPTLDGNEVQIKIAAGTQAGSILRLREQGLYPLNKRGDRGSLYV